jgi:Protein of unknown function (DUF2934)
MAASALADESTHEITMAPAEEDIAKLAYALWEARGCPVGSPEEDWFRAEAELVAGPSAAKE